MCRSMLLIGWFGVMTLASAEEAARAGHATLDVWRELPEQKFICWLQPDEVAGMRSKNAQHLVVPVDNLTQESGLCTVRIRCVVNAPQDGYYQFSVDAGGSQLVMLSDDATPAKLRTLWRADRLRKAVPHGPWRYLKKDQPRYLEIRHVYTTEAGAMTLTWTLPDGTKQNIPESCVTSYPASPDDDKDDSVATDGHLTPILKDLRGGPAINLDLTAAKALTNGWSSSLNQADPHDPQSKPKASTPGKPSLMCTFGGDLQLAFETKTAGYTILSTELQLNGWIHDFAHIRCEREIDGIRFGAETLGTRNSSPATVRCLTPWLTAGKHNLRLHFKPLPPVCSARLHAVTIQPITDEAAETVRKFFATENGFLAERGDGGFLRSPACVEVAATSSSEPVLTTNGETVKMALATRSSWWADVPLPESGAGLPLITRSSAYRTEAKATARWLETHIDAHPDLCLREGDALRLSAWPTDRSADEPGEAVVVVAGKEVATPPGKPYIYRFQNAGEETVEARFTQAGNTKTAQMKVHVLKRWKGVPGLPLRSDRSYFVTDTGCTPDVWLDGGDAVNCERKAPDGDHPNVYWIIAPRECGLSHYVTRAGLNGPILAIMPVKGVDVWTEQGKPHGPRTDNQLYEDLTKLERMPYQLCMVTGLPPDWKIHFRLFNGPEGPLHVYRPNDPAKPDEQTLVPWRMGATACAQLWLTGPTNPPGASTVVTLVPPETKPAN